MKNTDAAKPNIHKEKQPIMKRAAEMKDTKAFYAFLKALKEMNKKEILKFPENWRPWRYYATINLWNTL